MAGREVLLLAHGSKSPDYAMACEVFLDSWKQYSGMHARLCFLEQCEPLLEDVLADVAAHSRSMAVLPLLLNAGKHLRQDIPERLADFRQQHPETKLYLASGLTNTGVIAAALHDRAAEIQTDVQSTILLTHGSRQSGVQQHIMQLADRLAVRAGTKVHIAFAGYGSPSLEDVLTRQTAKGTVAIVPHFLFPGGWMKQVHVDMDTFRRTHSATEPVLAKHLGTHPLLLQLLLQQLKLS